MRKTPAPSMTPAEVHEQSLRNMRFEVAYHQTDASRRVNDTAARLRRNAESMRDRMVRLIERIDLGEALGGYAGINSLGEIQGHGSEIDRLCGELEVARRTVYEIERAIAAGRKLGELEARLIDLGVPGFGETIDAD